MAVDVCYYGTVRPSHLVESVPADELALHDLGTHWRYCVHACEVGRAFDWEYIDEIATPASIALVLPQYPPSSM